jgi:hypothetical protein
MACEAEVLRDLVPRLRGIDVPKLCGDAYRHCIKRGRESNQTIQDSMAEEERDAAAKVHLEHQCSLHLVLFDLFITSTYFTCLGTICH